MLTKKMLNDLSHTDRMVLSGWVRTGTTIEEIRTTSDIGILGNQRWSGKAVIVFKIIWAYSCYRYSYDYPTNLSYSQIKKRIKHCNDLLAYSGISK